MGIGRLLFKSLTKSARRNANRSVNSAITAALVTGVATATSVVVQNMIDENKARQANTNRQHNNPNTTSAPRDTYTDSMLGKIILCYYVAKVDGSIAPEEQVEIDSAVKEFFSNSKVSPAAKNELNKVLHMENLSFAIVEHYLNRVEPSILISFARDVDAIVNASDGVMPAEAKAIDMFKTYVTSKTGYTFEKKTPEPVQKEVSLICECCGGQMNVDETYLKATCPFCGAAKIIDSSQIAKVIAEIEKTKRIRGGSDYGTN